MGSKKGTKTDVIDGGTPAADRGIIGVLMKGIDHTMSERLYIPKKRGRIWITEQTVQLIICIDM